ncbi:MAG: hypothetical protein GFH27_549285n354 [Chloroflexi bacterium AL-W]|nr:hypothetical protein [Chloroflexi bacterium AL-N1]NOK65865.1 hypothetical protein [Chloroflexi bacterium AL-N10]NOK74194.1 hypothetical protein [Chloroflexi bacterium AL-N5]NOK80898.1 hypothetical protein [Chloroflexi bacterium AL-W]NOK88452.1 hypothetical protein [Chloroflexi bacterium AL-N15]
MLLGSLSGVFLFLMIVITIILLPHLDRDNSILREEPSRPTEEIHVKRDV